MDEIKKLTKQNDEKKMCSLWDSTNKEEIKKIRRRYTTWGKMSKLLKEIKTNKDFFFKVHFCFKIFHFLQRAQKVGKIIRKVFIYIFFFMKNF